MVMDETHLISSVIPPPLGAISRFRARGSAGSALLLVLLCSCGEVSPAHTSRRGAGLVAGDPPAADDFGAVVAMVVGSAAEKRHVRCTATLIGPSALLTAAHCLTGLEDAALAVVLGPNALDPDATALTISPSDRILHPQWTPPDHVPDDLVQFSDLALLRLGQPLSGIIPINLVDPERAGQSIRLGTPVLMVGLGRTDPADDTTAGRRMQGSGEISEVGRYEFRLQGLDDGGAAHKCDGDSGGPTFVQVGSAAKPRWELTGIGSRAHVGCHDGSVDTRVDAYLDWIHDVVDLPCGSGLSDPCANSEDDDSFGCTLTPRQPHGGPTSTGLLLLAALILCVIIPTAPRATSDDTK